jgi:hypothetical protein
MSQAPNSQAPDSKPSNPIDEPLDELTQANEPWWWRYSHHGEFPWSTVTSVVLHLFLVLLLVAAAAPLFTYDRTPPTVDVIDVADDLPAPGSANDLPGGGVEADAGEDVSKDVPKDTPTPPIDDIPKPKALDEAVPPADTGTQIDQLDDQLRDAQNRLNRALDQLRKNQNQAGGGSAGPGRGGSGGTGRGARAARWILKFNTRSPHDYLAQIDGLGAEIAFPQMGNEFLYFRNPGSSNASSERRSLAGETRINWVDRDPESVANVCSALGIPTTPFMLAFLPRQLEERLLKLELAYNGLEEHEILSTTFEVVHRGGGYDVIVANQVPR